jgi:hypothetical protein
MVAPWLSSENLVAPAAERTGRGRHSPAQDTVATTTIAYRSERVVGVEDRGTPEYGGCTAHLGCSGLVKRLRLLPHFLPLLCLVTVVALGRGSSAFEGTRDETARARGKHVVVVGSSSVKGTLGGVISADLERSGYQVSRVGIASAGIARPDYRDMQALIEGMGLDRSTAAVFVYLGVNEGQALWLRPTERRRRGERWLRWQDPRWRSIYQQRAQRLYETICQRGVKRTIVLLPVSVPKPRLERRLQRIRKLQRQAAERVSCATAISTAGDKGRFVVGGDPTRLPDGFHMTTLGARLVWERVIERASLRPEFRFPVASERRRTAPLVL